MDERDAIKRLHDLMRLDVDAVNVYDEALERAGDDDVRAQFSHFKQQHQDHADALCVALEGMGVEAPEQKQDLAGRLAEAYAVIRGATGTEGALRAMRAAERTYLRRYEEAVKWDVPPDVLELLTRFLVQERTHLAYIEEQLGMGQQAAQ